METMTEKSIDITGYHGELTKLTTTLIIPNHTHISGADSNLAILNFCG